MRKPQLVLAVVLAAAAVSAGAVVAFAHASPQQSPTPVEPAQTTPSPPTAASGPTPTRSEPAVTPANPKTAAG